jgi:polysaccharide biosynthesis/export protein
MTKFLAFFLVLFLSVPMGHALADGGSTATYRLRAGDSVFVSVWREEALNKEVRVLPDGSITYPLVGRVEVEGLSSVEVERKVAAGLGKYVSDPVVSVVITGIEGNRVHVLGKVLKSGPISMTGPTNVMQALSAAGGLDKFAHEDDIRVVRIAGGRYQVLPVRFSELISGRDMSTNQLLVPGDLIVVP